MPLKIIAKLKEYEELSKFKSLLVKTSEFQAVFDEIKRECGEDIISDMKREIDKIKKA
ncbi:hypothetical protein GCM10010211_65000 [Streptomyces albospinus]|uniref:Uncharacterized protein n=1 Tax=Streptomyces albospinus TaxID=285515 RepID=A0ABQ2VIP3_9ACTN|nr:hypothetical protein GCM10010211_65000 [Streptomyces albospinus]